VSTEPGAGQFLNCFNRVQAMVDKAIAQRDVEYLNELLSKETDENRRTILLRLLADAEDAAGGRARGEKRLRRANANGD